MNILEEPSFRDTVSKPTTAFELQDTVFRTWHLHEELMKQADSIFSTADDERASWYTLLSALQGEESQSRHWDATMRLSSVPGTFFKPPEYELTVGLQKKTRSWDFIPSSITKPYATSAICHLVEMMAMLGLYWKSFDQSSWNLRAEGNGYILTSTTVQGLGLMVVFSVTGSSTFKENRVIPCDAVKKLAFGNVPNIFEDDIYLNRETDAQSLELVFGTDDEVATTLEALGCQADTLKRYKVDHKHIFSGKHLKNPLEYIDVLIPKKKSPSRLLACLVKSFASEDQISVCYPIRLRIRG